jgi:hypothetical protein
MPASGCTCRPAAHSAWLPCTAAELLQPQASNAAAAYCLFAALGGSIISELLEGFSQTLAAYGQTGTGKTYTMARAGCYLNLVHGAQIKGSAWPVPSISLVQWIDFVAQPSLLGCFKKTTECKCWRPAERPDQTRLGAAFQ